MPVVEPVFVSDGPRFVPTEVSRSPWGPDSLHGGAAAALFGRAVESHEVDAPVHIARVTIELLRPVPYEPLLVETHTLRPGKKVQLIESVMTAGERQVSRAVALRIRLADVPLPDGVPADDEPPPRPPSAPPMAADWGWRAFHNEAMDIRFAQGRFEDEGPATVWTHLRSAVVDDEPATPAQRVLAAADFGNGVSRALPFGGWLFINPDLTVHLHRPPVGEWFCLDARTHLAPNGTGMAESALYDERGRIGRSLQSLLVDRL